MPMYEACDMSLLVRMANFAVASSAAKWTGCTWPVRRYFRSEDERFFAPPSELDRRGAHVSWGLFFHWTERRG